MNCPSLLKHPGGLTATGTTPSADRTIACDSDNLGKKIYIEGYGTKICEDTGGSIEGPGRFDIYMEDVQKAREFGGRKIVYRIIDE